MNGLKSALAVPNIAGTLFAALTSLFDKKEEKEIVLSLRRDGTRTLVFKEDCEFRVELGSVKQIARASNVEFNAEKGEWEVTFTGDTAPSFSHKLRSECIKWEVDYINAHMTEFADRLFPNEP